MTADGARIAHIAELARLQLDPDECAAYARDLPAILEFVAQMDTVDTGAVEPLAHPLELAARLRADEVTETDQRERFQAIAPQVEAGVYLVPKVIE